LLQNLLGYSAEQTPEGRLFRRAGYTWRIPQVITLERQELGVVQWISFSWLTSRLVAMGHSPVCDYVGWFDVKIVGGGSS